MLRLVTRLPSRLTYQCRPNRQLTLPLLNSTPASQARTFANSPILYKKKDKGKKAPAASETQSSPATPSEDPFDLTPLQTGISNAVSRLKDDLSKLRAGGRFNTANLEGLKVQLSKDSHDTVKLGDLAQVVPKGGRMVTILAAEEEVSLIPSHSSIQSFTRIIPRLIESTREYSISNPFLQQSSHQIYLSLHNQILTIHFN